MEARCKNPLFSPAGTTGSAMIAQFSDLGKPAGKVTVPHVIKSAMHFPAMSSMTARGQQAFVTA
jgi:hypothetical protein